MAASMSPELIAERIAQAIREKLFAPGTPLVQEDLARRFNVSRSPIREALRILSTNGLVTMESGGRATVRTLGLADLQELYDLRIILEPLIAEPVIELSAARDIRRLEQLAKHMESTESTHEWMRSNFDFHSMMYELAGRPHTQDILQGLLASVQPYSEENIDRLGGRIQADDEHRGMITAIQNGDEAELSSLFRQHLISARSRLVTVHSVDDLDEADPLAALRG